MTNSAKFGEWIGCDERVPEGGLDGLDEGIEDVLILYNRVCNSCLHKHGIHIFIGYYIDGGWKLAQPLDDDIFGDEDDKQINVIAWQPLPPNFMV